MGVAPPPAPRIKLVVFYLDRSICALSQWVMHAVSLPGRLKLRFAFRGRGGAHPGCLSVLLFPTLDLYARREDGTLVRVDDAARRQLPDEYRKIRDSSSKNVG